MARQHVSEPVPTQSPHVHYDNAIHICHLILEDTVESWSAAVELAESCYNSEPAWQPWTPAGQSAGAVSNTEATAAMMRQGADDDSWHSDDDVVADAGASADDGSWHSDE